MERQVRERVREVATRFAGLQLVPEGRPPARFWPWTSRDAVNELVGLVRALPELLSLLDLLEGELLDVRGRVSAYLHDHELGQRGLWTDPQYLERARLERLGPILERQPGVDLANLQGALWNLARVVLMSGWSSHGPTVDQLEVAPWEIRALAPNGLLAAYRAQGRKLDDVQRLLREALPWLERQASDDAESLALAIRTRLGLCATRGCDGVGEVGYEQGRFCRGCDDGLADA